ARAVPGAVPLTAAEMRVLDLLPTHLTLGEIADELHISRNTVKSQVAAVYRKLPAATRAEAGRDARSPGPHPARRRLPEAASGDPREGGPRSKKPRPRRVVTPAWPSIGTPVGNAFI